MGELGGFKKYVRKQETNAAVKERVQNYKEFTSPLPHVILPGSDLQILALAMLTQLASRAVERIGLNFIVFSLMLSIPF